LFERERERQHGGGRREREKQTPRGAGSPTRGPIPGPRDHDQSTRQTPKHLSHPGTPGENFLITTEPGKSRGPVFKGKVLGEGPNY